MSKEQVIFLDKETFNPTNRSAIDDDTKILNVLIVDTAPLTGFSIIRDKFASNSLIWLEFEKIRISRLDKLRICMGMAKLTSKFKKTAQELFPDVEIEYCEMLLNIGSTSLFKLAKQLAQQFPESPKDKNLFYSSGTMRIQRFYLIHWLQQNKISDIGHPKLNAQDLETFVYQLSKFSNYDFSDYKNDDKRFFGDIDIAVFNRKSYSMRCRSRITIVTSHPYFDFAESNYDEKVAFSFASKSLPFFFGNPKDNANLVDLGFHKYTGFDYSAEQNENLVERWQSTLESNKSFLLDKEQNFDIFQKNRQNIEFNFNLLISTDWEKKFLQELEKMPDLVRKLILSKKITPNL